MGPLASSLIWLLATIPLAEPAPRDPTHPGAASCPPLQGTPVPPDVGRRIRRREDTGEDGDGDKRFLRYALQQAEVNITDSPKRIQRPVEEALEGRPPPGRLAKRDNNWNWKHLEDYRGFLYFIERKICSYKRKDTDTKKVELGEPPQKVTLTPDTGSFETWVNPNCEYSASPILCQVNGAYSPDISSVSEPLDETFQFVYGSGWAVGQYFIDRMYFKRALMDEDVGVQQRFGMAFDSDYAVSGILGMGYGNGYNIQYNNIVDSMVEYDVINAQIYSVGLGQIGSGLSEIVFGGVNMGRFSGYLHPVPVWPPVNEQSESWVHYRANLTSLSYTSPLGSTTIFRGPPINTLVDTGSTYSLLPAAIVDALAEELGAWREVGEWKVDCKLRDVPGTVDFSFGDVEIRVSYSDFLLRIQEGSCSLGVQKREGAEDGDSILGGTFLRGAYVVFDQVSHNMWMANHQDCGSRVQEVGILRGDPGTLRGLC